MKLRYDPSRQTWHERLVRYDRRHAAWVPWHWRYVTGGGGPWPAIWRSWWGLLTVMLLSSCASHTMWINGAPVIEEYAVARVRIYRAGLECRVEIIAAAETVITLPTRCLTVPHVSRP